MGRWWESVHSPVACEVHLVSPRRSKNGFSVVREAVCGEVLLYSVAEAYPHVSAFKLSLQTTPQDREEVVARVTCEACKAALVQEALERSG